MSLTTETRTLPDGRVLLELKGKLNEQFDAQALAASVAGKGVVLHLGGIRHISSVGIREFERFLEKLGQTTLVEISPAVASHLVLLPNVGARLTVESAQLPFVCNACGNEATATVPWVHGAAAQHAPTCSCGKKMVLDGMPEQLLPSA